MRKINKDTRNKILKKTPWGHSALPHEEGLNEEQIKGLFYKAITDEDNSVISEINRIVEEGNKQFAEIDNTEYFGKLESDPLFANRQEWIRNGNLVYVYGRLPNLSSITENHSNPITNLGLGKNLVLRVTAPDWVIPDSSLTLQIGDNVFSGLTILNNSVEEAMKGVYYIRFSIRVNNIRKQTVSLKWNENSKFETVVFDFNDDYVSTSNKNLFIKFATDSSGSNAKDEWSEGMEYVGFLCSDEDLDASEYKWIKIPSSNSTPHLTMTTYSFQLNGWNPQNLCVVPAPAIREDSLLIMQPESTSHDAWNNSDICLRSQSKGSMIIACGNPSYTNLKFKLYVLNQE